MKHNLNFAFVLILFVLIVAACKKDIPREELLTTGSWRGESSFANVLGVTINLHDSIPACSKDDLTRFQTDKNVQIDEGPSKCDPSDPQTYSVGS
ncbi:MAG: hypothetical protein IPI60_08405 [Saprospiraceae bacterium]|nr:hypothetical protein [Saprospiraceae bacterium]